MSVLYEGSRRQQDAIMKITCFVGICVLLYGPLVSGSCNVTLHAQREPLNFTSPNYPGNYRNNDNCYWDIYPETSGYRVVLEMVFSNIEKSSDCTYDVLTIYVINNGDQSVALSRKACGINRWNILIQEDQHFHAVFKTDGSEVESGFLIRYYEKNGNGTCGVPLVATSTEKTFMSPGYPNSYFPSQTCTWTITTEHQNQTIQLVTMDSEIENFTRGSCDTDNVTVYNGQFGSNQLGTFCGNERPVFNSGGNTLSVRLQTDSYRNYKGFKMLYKAIPATTCNFTLPADYSPTVIVSPGYPNNYVSGLDCQWTINAPTGRNITVNVLFLDLEKGSACMEDYLLFKDGTTNDARQLAKICDRTSTPIVSSSNHMAIMFHSDSAVTGRGFRLQYLSASVCGLSDLSASSITWKLLGSPGYPSNYDNNLNCKWKIRAPVGFNIMVEIISLSVEYASYCSMDYLLIKDGSSFWAPQLGKYCGTIYNKQVVSSSNYMTIIFHTDGSTTRRGYNLQYKAGIFLSTRTTTEKPQCGSSLLSASKYSWSSLSSPGYPYNYNNNEHCQWTIFAPTGYKVKVKVQTISMEQDSSCSKDYVLFRDGSTSYATRLAKYCSDVIGYIVSSGSAMTITFRTDSSITDKGFSLRYIAQTAACGEDYMLSYATQYIESPNYPLSYPDNTDCEWTISTSIYGYVIHVEEVYFNIEYGSTCTYDYVQIYDVTSYERSIGRWCGSDGPNTQTTGQSMKIKFHSDGSSSRTGFKLSFTAGEPTPGEQTSDSVASRNVGAILGGVFGGMAVVGIATCCCYGLCSKKKSSPRIRSYERAVAFVNVPIYPQTPPIAPTVPSTPTVPTVLPVMSPPPPSYNDVVKDDPPPYCQAVPLSDIQPVLTSSPSGASEHQGIDNPAGPS